jgi:ribosomal protein L11 methyltransferase
LNWLEISVEVKDELAEPVAELFARYAEGGVAIEKIPASPTVPASDSTVTVRAYIPADERLEQCKQLLEEGLWHLHQIRPLPAATYRPIALQDWSINWRKHYHPIPIGSSLLVLPAWVEKPPGDRHPIILEPGMAFGTGTHPTTKLCLEAIEKYCRPGDFIIDLGCGSSILGIAGLRCGADRVLALDIDPDAIASAKHNIELNQLSDKVDLVLGGLHEAQQRSPPEGVPLLVANILAPILVDLLHKDLSLLVKNQGVVILSGILEHQLAEVLHAANSNSLKQVELLSDDDWRALVMVKA